jgi:hypothetical protein
MIFMGSNLSSFISRRHKVHAAYALSASATNGLVVAEPLNGVNGAPQDGRPSTR